MAPSTEFARDFCGLFFALSVSHWAYIELRQLDRSLMIAWKESTTKALKGVSSVITLVYVCLYVLMSVVKLMIFEKSLSNVY